MRVISRLLCSTLTYLLFVLPSSLSDTRPGILYRLVPSSRVIFDAVQILYPAVAVLRQSHRYPLISRVTRGVQPGRLELWSMHMDSTWVELLLVCCGRLLQEALLAVSTGVRRAVGRSFGLWRYFGRGRCNISSRRRCVVEMSCLNPS
jgi:hypothetical protein